MTPSLITHADALGADLNTVAATQDKTKRALLQELESLHLLLHAPDDGSAPLPLPATDVTDNPTGTRPSRANLRKPPQLHAALAAELKAMQSSLFSSDELPVTRQQINLQPNPRPSNPFRTQEPLAQSSEVLKRQQLTEHIVERQLAQFELELREQLARLSVASLEKMR